MRAQQDAAQQNEVAQANLTLLILRCFKRYIDIDQREMDVCQTGIVHVTGALMLCECSLAWAFRSLALGPAVLGCWDLGWRHTGSHGEVALSSGTFGQPWEHATISENDPSMERARITNITDHGSAE